jgi:urate oxidase
MTTVAENRYGKEGIRLVRVRRSPYNGNTFDEWTVRVLIEGDFVSSYAEADNSKVLATDTMKNTVYYVAQRTRTNSMEDFAKELVNFLLERHSQISSVNVTVERKAWSNIITSNNVRHPTSFTQTSNEVQLTKVKRSRHGAFSIVSGLKDLKVMKTANSSFARFYRDSLTTLADSTDRLFGTAIQAMWTYDDPSSIIDFDKTRQQIRGLMLDVFANHHSESVQHTLHAIGKYILEHVPSINKIHLTMPNIHCFPVDLTRFGEQNKNEIFMPVDDPHGYIQCALTRSPKREYPLSKL